MERICKAVKGEKKDIERPLEICDGYPLKCQLSSKSHMHLRKIVKAMGDKKKKKTTAK